MTRQNINVGTIPNDGTGDPLRTGMIKVNDNFTELYTDAPISNTVTVGNTTVNTFINATAVFIGNSSVNTHITSNSISTKDITITGDLTVTGNVSFEGETLFSNAINITTTDKMFILANGTATAVAANNSGIAINTWANLIYVSTASGWQSNVNFVPAANNLTIGNTTSVWKVYANTINAVNISTTSNTTQFGTAVYVSASGNVGIGNSAPVDKLSVNGTTYLGGAVSSSTNTFTIGTAAYYVANGNFGIGTSSPLVPGIHIGSGVTGGQAQLRLDNSSGNSALLAAWSNRFELSTTAGYSFAFAPGAVGNTAVWLASNGNVGIGNSTPTDKLSINGTTYHQGNVILGSSSIAVGLQANGSYGTSGQVLTSNGTTVYWSSTSPTTNTDASYTWTNTHSFTNTVTLKAVSSNGSIGSAGQYLTSNGTSTYWSTPGAVSVNVSAQYTWTNTQTFTNTITFSSTTYYGNTTTNTSITNGLVQTTNGFYSVGQFNGTYTDGTVVDYVTGNGRISVGSADSLSFYTGGVGSTLLLSVNSTALNVPTTTGLYVNGSLGTANQVLTTNGTGVYWANASGGGGGTSIALNANNTDSNTYYLPMSNVISGTWSNGVVSSTLYYVPSTGTLNATVFNSLSDREKKENIENITDALEIIKALNGVRFDWKSNHQPSAGLIAQDVEAVMPELVHTDPITGDKSLNYSGVIAVLVEAVKHLINKG